MWYFTISIYLKIKMNISKFFQEKEVKHPQPALKQQESAASGICHLLYNLCNSLAICQNTLFVTEPCHCEAKNIGF